MVARPAASLLLHATNRENKMSHRIQCPLCDGRLSHPIPADAANVSRTCRGCKVRWTIDVLPSGRIFFCAAASQWLVLEARVWR